MHQKKINNEKAYQLVKDLTAEKLIILQQYKFLMKSGKYPTEERETFNRVSVNSLTQW